MFNYSEIEQTSASATTVFVMFEGMSEFPKFYDEDNKLINGYVIYSFKDAFDPIESELEFPKDWKVYPGDEEFGGSIYSEGADDILESFTLYESSPSVELEINKPYKCVEGKNEFVFKINNDFEPELIK